MTIQNHNFEAVHFVATLQFLLSQARGPKSTKQQIADWLDLLEEDDALTWQINTLKSLFDALAVLAFANAAFRMLPAPARNTDLLSFEIEDRGGYFIALKTIGTVISVAPLCEECQSELIEHVERTLLMLLEQVDKLLARK
jgi:hypothetical protein